MTTAHRTSVLALLLAATIACGPPTTTATPTPSPSSGQSEAPTVKSTPTEVAPLQVHQKQAGQHAVILGTETDGRASRVLLASDEQRVEVDVMWVRTSKPATGGVSRVHLTTEPQEDKQVRVGVFEQYSGGLGEQSRSSVWLASFLAASTLGYDLTDFKFSAEVKGFVDGPSAGALYTAAFLAALTGEKIDPAATMTGTVNPDGTVGPVGGIPQKFLGSIAKGKKKLGYPIGLRYATDANTGKPVDLHKLAADNGAVAVEVRDIYDAYRLLTGKQLPRTRPLDVAGMAMPGPVVAKMREKYGEWRKLLENNFRVIVQVAQAGKMPEELKKIALRALSEAKAADIALKQNLVAVAYQKVVNATVYAISVNRIFTIMKEVQEGRTGEAVTMIKNQVNTVNRTIESMRVIGKRHPDTIGGHLLMISAFQKGAAGVGSAIWGMEQVERVSKTLAAATKQPEEQRKSAATAEALVRALGPLIINFVRGQGWATQGIDALTIESAQTINYSCSEPAARQLGKSFSSAAQANLRYFESILLKEIGKQTGLAEDKARALLSKIEPNYIVAMTAARMASGSVPFVEKLKKEFGEESLAWSLHSLGGGIMSYFKSSLLISRYYSLQVKKDRATGRALGVAHPKALAYMIETAERTAREHAHAAKIAVGQVPVQALIEFERAKALGKGSLDDRINALEGFWASSRYSQTAVVMARHVINPKKHGAHGSQLE